MTDYGPTANRDKKHGTGVAACAAGEDTGLALSAAVILKSSLKLGTVDLLLGIKGLTRRIIVLESSSGHSSQSPMT